MTRIRLRGPGDVLVSLPYQLGYHPHDCVVAVCLHGREVGCIQRIDLPAIDDLEATARSLVASISSAHPGGVLLVGYEDCADDSAPLLGAVQEELGVLQVDVIDTLVVRDGRYFSPGCSQGCCPPEGTVLPEPSSTPAVADFVALGRSALASRADLTASVAVNVGQARRVGLLLDSRAGSRRGGRAEAALPVSHQGQAFGLAPGAGAADPESEQRLAHAREVQRLRWLAVWAKLCDPCDDKPEAQLLEAAEVAQLVDSLRDVALRDSIIAWLCPGSLPLELLDEDVVDAVRLSLSRPRLRVVGSPSAGGRGTTVDPTSSQRLLSRLRTVCRAVPDRHAAGVLTVLANLAWWSGDGTLARVALDRALEHRPDYRLAQLLARMLDLGVPPHRDQVERVRGGKGPSA